MALNGEDILYKLDVQPLGKWRPGKVTKASASDPNIADLAVFASPTDAGTFSNNRCVLLSGKAHGTSNGQWAYPGEVADAERVG
jgi:hypothetical protein